ncbi:hypothetical protein HAZT_HAZT007087 [Hyalella azteca]|uniref:Succinate dehydrogenase assembly factor 3 n=1 Tax=Hyalella azteca TaxID=294128 RepID=A0A6A0H8V9_HYAAZ|nr:hypothetical protein HAZT_HAZT007087 [Hyalella azteca]
MDDALSHLRDEYAKAEFKAHKNAEPQFVSTFMTEWSSYAVQLSKQLGVRGAHLAKPVGSNLQVEMLDLFTEEQLRQLFQLYSEAKGDNEIVTNDEKR